MIVAPLVMIAAVVMSPFRPVPAETVQVVGSTDKSTCTKRAMVSGRSEGQGIAHLPFSNGRKFATLDAYLVHLECYAQPVDYPWYEEISPGVYKLHSGNLRVLGLENDETPREHTYTRDELKKKFGFTK